MGVAQSVQLSAMLRVSMAVLYSYLVSYVIFFNWGKCHACVARVVFLFFFYFQCSDNILELELLMWKDT